MDSTPVIRSFEALINEESEVADAFLLAAVYARSVQQDISPREVVDSLFRAMPSTESWPALRSALIAAAER